MRDPRKRLRPAILLIFILLLPALLAAFPDPGDSIYFLIIDRFHDGDPANNNEVDRNDILAFHGGDFRGIIERLDYIRALGSSAILLSPVTSSPEYHGYLLLEDRVTGESFGSMDELKDLVHRARIRGMDLLIDLVVDASDPLLAAGTASFWVQELGHAGFRIPDTDRLPDSFWASFAAELRRLHPEIFLIARTEDASTQRADLLRGLGFDAVMDLKLLQALRQSIRDGEPMGELGLALEEAGLAEEPGGTEVLPAVSAEEPEEPEGLAAAEVLPSIPARGRPGPESPDGRIAFIDNQDLTRFINRAGRNKDQKLSQALLLLYTQPAIPMLYYASEFPIDAPGEHTGRASLPWEEEARFAGLIAQLAGLRREMPALHSGKIRPLIVETQVLVFAREYEGQTVLVVLNNSDVPLSLEIPLGDSTLPRQASESGSGYQSAFEILGPDWLGEGTDAVSAAFANPSFGEAEAKGLRASARAASVRLARDFRGEGIGSLEELKESARRFAIHEGKLLLPLEAHTGSLLLLDPDPTGLPQWVFLLIGGIILLVMLLAASLVKLSGGRRPQASERISRLPAGGGFPRTRAGRRGPR